MAEVTLNHWEVALAGFVGVLRNTESMKKNHKTKTGDKPAYEIGVQGAAAELAAAKFLNVYPSQGINTFKAADIGIGLQVRQVTNPEGELPIREGDKDEELFLMVTGVVPTFKIVGWISGADGRRLGVLKNPGNLRPAHFVAQKHLRPMEKLPIDRTLGGIQ